jgi:hypothetical protein
MSAAAWDAAYLLAFSVIFGGGILFVFWLAACLTAAARGPRRNRRRSWIARAFASRGLPRPSADAMRRGSSEEFRRIVSRG